MPTVKQLEKEIRILKAKKIKEVNVKKLLAEKQMLMRENSDLKNPHSPTFKRNLKRGFLKSGKSLFRFLEVMTRPTPKRK